MEEQKENLFAISEKQLQALVNYLAQLPYNQVQPFVELLVKLPKIQVNEDTTGQN